jgi:miniconductance mechanosensitive channel
MCRQLQSTVNGVPLEIYAFTSDKRWRVEFVMSDVLITLHQFPTWIGVFELPSKVSIINLIYKTIALVSERLSCD